MVIGRIPCGHLLGKGMSVFAFLWLLPVLLSAQETFRDNFSSVSYSNNNGTRNFATSWQESGDDNSPSSGRIDINSSQLRFNDLDNAQISRTLNLQGATSVVLTMNYNRTSGDENIDVQLWNGSGWNTIANLAGTGTVNHVLIAAEISASSAIRFLSGSGNWSNGEIIFVDNVLFTATFAPNISINDISVNEADGTAVFTVTLLNTATGGFTVNYATSNGTALAGSDYVAATGTINFAGTNGETHTISILLINDNVPEYQAETFTVTLGSPSNPAVIIADGIGIATISDDEYLFNTPLVLKEEFNGYVDYTTTGGTLRTQPNTGDACAITTSSNNTLIGAVPAGATIQKAILYWAHSGATPDAQVMLDGNVVNAQIVYGTSLTNRNFYGGRSDITAYVTSLPALSTHNFVFSGLTIDNTGNYCSTATVLGAWSIMVFYSNTGLPASTINVYEGFSGESNSSSSYTLGGFFAIGASGSKTTVLSWEGDQNLSNNERLSVTTGLGTFTLVGDGDNNGITTNNPFNSTIFDNTVTPTVNNTAAHGLDLDTYNVSPYVVPGESSVTTTVQSGQDFVIVNAVVLKVPSNLVTGVVFEDLNYGGGPGRNLATSGGVPLPGVTMELYQGATLRATTTTNASGKYVFGGMTNGTFTIRAVNGSVRSSRPGGSTCASCIPVQTYKTDYLLGALVENFNLVGGQNPAAVDPGPGTLTGAQSRSSITILNQGVAGMDFGFNFNTIVNSNKNAQGSLNQFIVNSNALGETGLDILPNALFDPAAGKDVSVFMIPPTGDALGRAADANYSGGVFNINIPNSDPLTVVTGTNTQIDGRTQTAYSGNSNPGNVGSGGAAVGVGGALLPIFDRPEIQVHRDNGDVLQLQGNAVLLRNLSVYASNNAGILIMAGTATVSNSLLGVNASGVNAGAIHFGVAVTGGQATIQGNYIASNTNAGIFINGGTATTIEDNQVELNGSAACDDNILLQGGSGITIRRNLIQNAAALGIDGNGMPGNIVISENTITGSGRDGGNCGGKVENAGIRLDGSNSLITRNRIYGNGGAGIVLAGGTTSGNTISQNSIYANGTIVNSLGIDLDPSDGLGDGVTLNDSGDTDTGPNGSLNFPILTGAYLEAGNVVVKGFARPGALIEFFLTDINQGTAPLGANQLGKSVDYGEGQVYLGGLTEGSASDSDAGFGPYSDIDGNTDTANRFEFRVPVQPGMIVGTYLTATATLAGSTSEFSPFGRITLRSLITNRRITYRVNPI